MVKQRQRGKIIFISSGHEDIPFPGYTAYCAAKGGIRMMMRNLAMELAQYHINVNNIAPGAISTPINGPKVCPALRLRRRHAAKDHPGCHSNGRLAR